MLVLSQQVDGQRRFTTAKLVNHMRNGSLVSANRVPLVSDTCRLQRLLKDANQARDRRPIRPPQSDAVPRLQASAAAGEQPQRVLRSLLQDPQDPARLPGAISDTSHARSGCGGFIDGTNDKHQHSGLHGHIPADAFYGRAKAVTTVKWRALDDAYHRHPERFVDGPPQAKAPPAIASITPLPESVISLPTAARNNDVRKPPRYSAGTPPPQPHSTAIGCKTRPG